jgi:hypothetical protein
MSEKDAIDRILSSEDPIMPSSGFMAGVMGAVEEADSAPPPLPFPWRRFILGVIAILVSVASGVWLLSVPESSFVPPVVNRVWVDLGYATATFVGTLALMYAPRLQVTVYRLLSRGLSPWTISRGSYL